MRVQWSSSPNVAFDSCQLTSIEKAVVGSCLTDEVQMGQISPPERGLMARPVPQGDHLLYLVVRLKHFIGTARYCLT